MKFKLTIKMTLFLCIFFLLACESSKEHEKSFETDVQTAAKEETVIKNTLTAMWAAIENENLEVYASYIHPDFTQFGESDPLLRIGKEAEVRGIKEWVESSSNIHTEMEEPRVVIRGNVAWILYYWNDHGTTNGEAFATRGKSTRIFVRENGKWLCIHGHYTLLP